MADRGNASRAVADGAPLPAVGAGGPQDDRPADLGRIAESLRRAAPLIALIVLPLTAAVLVLSLLLPKEYTATARLVSDEPAGVLQTDDAATQRRLATVETMVRSRDVLTRAARTLPGETQRSLQDKVTAKVDSVANIVDVTATDGTAREAAANANAVARAFLDSRRSDERLRLRQARADLEQALSRLSGRADASLEARAIRQRLSELSVSEASAGQDLQLGEAATPPDGPSAPKPVQNTLFAIFGSLLLAILLALARDFFAPRVRSVHDLGALTGLEPLLVLPTSRRRQRSIALQDVFGALQEIVTARLPAGARTLLVTSASPGEHAPTVAANLARALERAGHPVRLIDGGADRAAADEALLGEADGDELAVIQGPPLLSRLEGQLMAQRADAILIATRLDRLSPGDAEQLGELVQRLDAARIGAVVLGPGRSAVLYARPVRRVSERRPSRRATRREAGAEAPREPSRPR
jgi:capsular polysaccharide biosynthesis protein